MNDGQFYYQMLHQSKGPGVCGKENLFRNKKPTRTRNSNLEMEAQSNLSLLSEIDMNRVRVPGLEDITAWDGKRSSRLGKSIQKHTGQNSQEKPISLNVKYRRFSFWKKTSPRDSLDRMGRYQCIASRGQSFNLSKAKDCSEQVNSNEIFVRKFPKRDSNSHTELGKPYLINSSFVQNNSNKNRSFEAYSRTILLGKRRPRTSNNNNFPGLLDNKTCQNPSQGNKMGKQIKLVQLIAQSQKLIRKAKCNNFIKLQRQDKQKSNPFIRTIKEKYSHLIPLPLDGRPD